jgi:predicted house-cleaning NTP pyrophosphatase (Maf/HAM1 superfamily)
MTERHKFSVGAFQGWLCGSQHWEVRHRDGLVMGRAKNMMECARIATRFSDQKTELDEARVVLETSKYQTLERVEQARATFAALKRRNT